MADENYTGAGLVLLGHGSTQHPDAGAAVRVQAVALRQRGCLADVREAFWKQEPQIKTVLSDLPPSFSRMFIVPLFVSEGYFSEEVIPQALGFELGLDGRLSRVRQQGLQTFYYCRPVGTHPRMAEVLLDRAEAIVRQFPFPRAPRPTETTLFIAGHGTPQDENSREAVERQAEAIRAMGRYAAVQAVFLEEPPRIAGCLETAATKHVVVVPFFMSDGLHVAKDIPLLLGAPERVLEQRLATGQPAWRNPTEKQGRLVWYSTSVGSDPRLAGVILERVREAAGWPGGES